MAGEYQWHHSADGRSVYRKTGQAQRTRRSDFPCPTLIRDSIPPVRSMANGKMYDSLSALRQTYRADGNPQRQDYIEIGDAPMNGPPKRPDMTKAQISDLLDKTEAQIARGEVPPAKAVEA